VGPRDGLDEVVKRKILALQEIVPWVLIPKSFTLLIGLSQLIT